MEEIERPQEGAPGDGQETAADKRAGLELVEQGGVVSETESEADTAIKSEAGILTETYTDKPEAQSAEVPLSSRTRAETITPQEAEEIEHIRQELGIGADRQETQEITDEGAQKFERVVDFLGLKTEAVFGREQALQILPELDETKLETVHNLAGSAEKRYELREQLRVFSEIFDLSVEEMRDVIDTTSAWTEDHSTRLTILASQIADRMWPFDAQFKKSLWQTGLLHDVGKVATPKSILDKDGRLTPQEREVINRHPADGDRLLANLVRHNPFIADGTKHHEKWGGGGYSYGLQGSEIPLASQILSVTDVFDAMSSERPYKAGLSPEKCIQTIEEMSHPRQALDDRGEVVTDPKTGEPIIISEYFSNLPVAYFRVMYGNRELSVRDYFDAKSGEAQITRELEGTGQYAKAENEKVLAQDKQTIGELLSSALKDFKVIAPEDIKRYINQMDKTAAVALAEEWSRQTQELEAERDRSQEVVVDVLFLLVKSIDARYRAYHEGNDTDRLSGGQARTENVIRYALMLAQQMGMDIEEQKKVAMAAMFCDFGVLGIDETKVRSDKTLGVTSFEELKQAPAIGCKLLQKFTNNPDHPEVAKYFAGAELGAAEAHLWANGKGGYGVRLNPDGKPSTIGQIVSIAYKYTAMRADNPYRGEGLNMNKTMDIMRKGVGAEFDPELWKHWEALYARDVLRIFKDRVEVVGDVKRIFKGEESPIVFYSPDRQKLIDYSEEIINTKDGNEKLQLCYEAARYASQIGLPNAMERFIELAEPLAIQRGDEDILRIMWELYDYDLEQSKQMGLENVQKRIETGDVLKAIKAVESLATDFSEKGRAIGPELAEEIRGAIIPAYKDFVERKLKEYEDNVQAMDEDILARDEEILRQGLQAIGDAQFTARIEREMNRIEQEKKKRQVEVCIEQIREFADEKNDTFNGEHFVAKAESVFKELTPENQKLLTVGKESVRRALYRRGYSVAFEQLQKEAQAGNVHIVLELEKRVRRWMDEARERGIAEREFAEQKQTAYRQGVAKMREFLAADDLGLEDIPKVDRWLGNINEWQEMANRPTSERISVEELREMKTKAFGKIKENMLVEIDAIIQSDSQAELKRLVVMVSDYIIEPNNLALRTHELDGKMTVIRNKLFDSFTASIKRQTEAGEAEKVSSAIYYFHKFCGGDGRGEIVGLTETQREALQDLRREVYKNSLMARVNNITELGADARISQLEREVERLKEDRENLEEMGEKVDTELFTQQINDAIYKSLTSKITFAIKEKDIRTIALATEKISKLINDGVIQKNEVVMASIRELAVPLGEEVLDDLVEFGKFEDFELLQKTLQTAGGEEAQEFLSEMEKVKAECAKNYAHRLMIKLQIHGIKSYIDLMRQEEEKLIELEKNIPGVVDPAIFQESQKMAETIIQTYRMGIISCKSLGPLGHRSLDYTREYMGECIQKLKNIPAGSRDIIAFEQLLADA